MKVLIFLGLIAAVFAIRLTTHDYDDYEWVPPTGDCEEHLIGHLTNNNGKI